MIIYLDESGDLGCDFEHKHPSRYFVITVLICKSSLADKHLQNALSRTIKNKLSYKVDELKGVKTELSVKTYFLTQLRKSGLEHFEIHAVVVDKRKLQKTDIFNKEHLYNQITVSLLEKVTYSAGQSVILVADKCKNKYEMSSFDSFLQEKIALPKKIVLQVRHHQSNSNKGLQAVDLFCWGIFRKYEQKDESWYSQFKEMIFYEKEY